MSLVLPPFRRRASGFYPIKNAIELRAASSQYLSRTFGAGNRKLWSFHCRVRRTRFGVEYGDTLFSAGTKYLAFRTGQGPEALEFYENDKYITSAALYRDPSSWLDVLIVWDSANATATDRMRMYVNGVRAALARSSYPTQNEDSTFNSALAHEIGRSNGVYADCVITDVHFIDGAALDPTAFGQFDKDGRWVAKKYAEPKTLPGVRGVVGTPFGDMTSGGGVAAAFDGNTGTAARSADSTLIGYVGLGGLTTGITGFVASVRTNSSSCNMQAKLYGKNGAPANSTDGTLLYTGPVFSATTANAVQTFPNVITSPATYSNVWVRVEVTSGGGAGTYAIVDELQLFDASTLSAYGPNGFRLDFADSADLGADHVGGYSLDIPKMTSPTAPSGIASCSGTWNGLAYFIHQAFDRDNTTVWESNTTTGWLAYEYPSAKVVTAYSIRASGATSRAPQNWTFEGWTGSAWVVLHSVTGQTGWTAGGWRNYAFANTTAYIKYRINVTAINGASDCVEFAELRFWTAGGSLGLNGWDAVNAPVQTADTPTNVSIRFDPLNHFAAGSTGTLSNAALTVTLASNTAVAASLPIPKTGKWFAAFQYVSGTYNVFGIAMPKALVAGAIANAVTFYGNGGNGLVLSPPANQPAADANSPNTAGDWQLVAVDMDAGKVWLGRKRSGVTVWMGGGDPAAGTSPTVSKAGAGGVYGTGLDLALDDWFFVASGASACVMNADFDQRTVTAPTGFQSLPTSLQLPKPAISDPGKHFDVALYTGASPSTVVVNALEFSPGILWLKSRAVGGQHALVDTLRGRTKLLSTNDAAAEATIATALTSFDANGFTLGTDDTPYTSMNYPGRAAVAWAWGGFTQMTAPEIAALVTASSATITPSGIAVNAKAGFAVITYIGNGVAGATLPNPLGKAPDFMIAKGRTNAYSWPVYHRKSGGSPGYGYLDSTAAFYTTAAIWSAHPTSTVISLASDVSINGNGATFVVYVFTSIDGFSAFGSYTGNGAADGPRVYLPFRPAFLMVKGASYASYDWWMFDDVRSQFNLTDKSICANLAGAEAVNTGIDLLANGLKVRSSGPAFNTSAGTILYAAFARYPFGGGSVPPVPAR